VFNECCKDAKSLSVNMIMHVKSNNTRQELECQQPGQITNMSNICTP